MLPPLKALYDYGIEKLFFIEFMDRATTKSVCCLHFKFCHTNTGVFTTEKYI